MTSINVDSENQSFSSINGVLFNKNQTILLELPASYSGPYSIPNTVTSIGPSAFAVCFNLGGVSIPNSVISIGENAFFGDYRSLTNISIPSSVRFIGERAFGGCSSLAAISIDSLNSVYTSLDGVVLSKDRSSLVVYPPGKHGAYVVPGGITSIANYAFSGCEYLTDISIAPSVTNIGINAFEHCSALSSIKIPNEVASLGGFAFSDCTGLTNILLGSGVTTIGIWTFDHCTSLTKVLIPENVTSIENGAFGDCMSLTDVVIGSGVTNIGNYAFAYGVPRAIYFWGDAPQVSPYTFNYPSNTQSTAYYIPGTLGWGPT
jgi:hypothetical protein